MSWERVADFEAFNHDEHSEAVDVQVETPPRVYRSRIQGGDDTPRLIEWFEDVDGPSLLTTPSRISPFPASGRRSRPKTFWDNFQWHKERSGK